MTEQHYITRKILCEMRLKRTNLKNQLLPSGMSFKKYCQVCLLIFSLRYVMSRHFFFILFFARLHVIHSKMHHIPVQH